MLPYFVLGSEEQPHIRLPFMTLTHRHDRRINASVRLWAAFGAVVNLVQEDSDGFFYTWKMGQLSAILAPAPSFPSQLAQNPGGMRTHCGTKHSISASDITAVSSAVSACAKNSVAERADCLCRKYLTPEPEPWEKYILFVHGSGKLDLFQGCGHKIFVHAHLMVVCLNSGTVFLFKSERAQYLSDEFMAPDRAF